MSQGKQEAEITTAAAEYATRIAATAARTNASAAARAAKVRAAAERRAAAAREAAVRAERRVEEAERAVRAAERAEAEAKAARSEAAEEWRAAARRAGLLCAAVLTLAVGCATGPARVCTVDGIADGIARVEVYHTAPDALEYVHVPTAVIGTAREGERVPCP